jgi:hypothetical protein
MPGILQAKFMVPAAATGWAFRSVGSVGTNTNPVAGMPAGFAAGDLLVIVGVSGAAFTDPAGWTIWRNGGANPRLSAWYKISSGGETAVTVTNSNSSSQVIMLAYSGINATPLDLLGTANTTLTTTSLTTTVANDLVISIFGNSTTADTWTSTPASTNVRYNGGGVVGARSMLIVDELKTTAGATTTRTAVANSAGSIAADAAAFKI